MNESGAKRYRQQQLVEKEKSPSHRVVESSVFVEDFSVLLAEADALAFLRTIPDNVAQLVVTSPPYNIGKPYEKRTELKDYLSWQEKVLRECTRVLAQSGSLCWQSGNYIENAEVFPLDIYFYDLIKNKCGLSLRNRIIWTFEHGLHASRRFSGRYETILWFTKSDKYVFNLDAVRVPQKYPGKTHYKGPNHGKPSGNPLGKNPSDIWRILSEDWDSLIWDIPNVKSRHPEKTIHPAQFPVELVERLVLALTNENDIVFDPFMGVGSALLAAILHRRRAIGVDFKREYFEIAKDRVAKALAGELIYRKLGTRKYEPSGKEKVSRKPADWS